MSNDLMVINGVGKTVSRLIKVWRERGELNQQQRIRIEESIALYRRELRTTGIGRIANENLNLVMAMSQKINSANLSGPALDMAMEQLTTLHEELTKNLKGYSDGIK